MFVGEKGVIINDGGDRKPEIYPLSLRESYQTPEESIPRSKGHFRDWIDAIKEGGQSSTNLDYGSQLTELTLLRSEERRVGKEWRSGRGQGAHGDRVDCDEAGV